MKGVLLLAAALALPLFGGCLFVGKHHGHRFAVVWIPRPIVIESGHRCGSGCGAHIDCVRVGR